MPTDLGGDFVSLGMVFTFLPFWGFIYFVLGCITHMHHVGALYMMNVMT